MKKKQKDIFSKREIDMADYIFANPDFGRREVIEHFQGIWTVNISEGTLKNVYYRAKEYIKPRIAEIENAKNEKFIRNAKTAAKSMVLSRDESIEILSKIAQGSARKVGERMLIPSDSERTRAITVLAELNGWNAPVKSDVNVHHQSITIELTQGNE